MNKAQLKIVYILIVTALSVSQNGHTQTISTIAGGSPEGYEAFSQGVGAPLANINDIGYALALDPQGRVYFGSSYPRLYRINEASLKLELIAGNGNGAETGDGGLAINATFSTILGLAIDNNNNIYFAGLTDRIRHINSSGIISTYAGTGTQGFSGDGGPAISAKITNATALATDSQRNLYFYDGTFRIRRIDFITKIITTVAGNGTSGNSGDGGLATSASFGTRIDIACDLSGNLIVADNHKIRKVDIGTGIVTTIAGDGIAGFSGDGGLASLSRINEASSLDVDDSGNIFFIDVNNHRIRKISSSNQFISTVAGTGGIGKPGYFNGEGGAATDATLLLSLPSQGSGFIGVAPNKSIVYVGPQRMWRIDAIGTLRLLYGYTLYFGDGVAATDASLNAPSGIWIEGNQLYVGDQGSYRIRKVNLGTGTITNFGGIGESSAVGDGGPVASAGFSNIFIIRSDVDGHLFVTDFGNHAIRRIDKSTGTVTTYAGLLASPGFSGDGGPASLARMILPTSIAFDQNWNLYIADRGNSRIRKVDRATGIISTIAGNGTAGFSGDGGLALNASFNQISHLTFDPNWNLIISDRLNHRIRKLDFSTGIVTTLVGNGQTDYPGDGHLPLQIGLDFPYGTAFDDRRNMYIADGNLNRIFKLDATTGTVTTVAGTGLSGVSGDNGLATSAQLNFPRDIIFDAQGALLVADYGNGRIRRIDGLAEVTASTSPESQYKFFPNPAHDVLIVESAEGHAETLSFEAVDTWGRISSLPSQFDGQQYRLYVRPLEIGLYVLRVRKSGKVIQSVRFVRMD